MRIEIIAGSPRKGSATRRVARYLHHIMQERCGHAVGLIDAHEHPLPQLEKVFATVEEAPLEWQPLARRMFGADAFIIVTPEYNGSYSPAMQNMFDHFPKQHHKPFGLVTASPGAMGGMRAAMQLQQFVLALFGIPSPYMLIVPGLDKKFSPEGDLIDHSFQKNIDVFIKEFLWLAESLVPEKMPALK